MTLVTDPSCCILGKTGALRNPGPGFQDVTEVCSTEREWMRFVSVGSSTYKQMCGSNTEDCVKPDPGLWFLVFPVKTHQTG